MKLSKLVDPQFQAALRKLAAQEIPLKTAFAVKGIIKVVNEELAKYDEVRQDALKRFGNKKEDGSLDVNEQGSVALSDDNAALFAAELNDMLRTEVNVKSIKVSDLGEKVNLTANDLLTLDDIVAD